MQDKIIIKKHAVTLQMYIFLLYIARKNKYYNIYIILFKHKTIDFRKIA